MVFDLTSQESFSHMKSWMDEFTRQTGGTRPCVLIGNKADLADTRRQITSKTAKSWCQEEGLHGNTVDDAAYFECSAKDSIMVDDAFHHVAAEALKFKKSKLLIENSGDQGGDGKVADVKQRSGGKRLKEPACASC